MSNHRIASPKNYPKEVSLPHLKNYPGGTEFVTHKIKSGGRNGTKKRVLPIPKKELEGIVKQLELRKKHEKEIRAYKKRIAYLNKILGSGKKAG